MKVVGQAALEEELDQQLDQRLDGVLPADSAPRRAFDQLSRLESRRIPPPMTDHRRKSHRRELRHRVLAVCDALKLKAHVKGGDPRGLRRLASEKEKKRYGITLKTRAGLSKRLASIEKSNEERRALAADIQALLFSPESPIEKLLARAFHASQTDREAEALEICRQVDGLQELPDLLRRGQQIGAAQAADLLDPNEAGLVPTHAKGQKLRLLNYVKGWSGKQHFREVALIVLHLEGKNTTDLAVQIQIATLQRLSRGSKNNIAVPLTPSL